jgi:hypothetical protein
MNGSVPQYRGRKYGQKSWTAPENDLCPVRCLSDIDIARAKLPKDINSSKSDGSKYDSYTGTMGDLDLGKVGKDDGVPGYLTDSNGTQIFHVTGKATLKKNGQSVTVQPGQMFDRSTGKEIKKGYTYDGKSYSSESKLLEENPNLDGDVPLRDTQGDLVRTDHYQDGVKISSTNSDNEETYDADKSVADWQSSLSDSTPDPTDKAGKKEARKKARQARDLCKNSRLINGKYECGTTANLITTTQVANQVLQGSGAQAINSLGARVATPNMTMQQGYQNAAKLSRMGESYEMTVGAANLAAAAVLRSQARKHAQNSAAISAEGKNLSAVQLGQKAGNNAEAGKKLYQNAINEQDDYNVKAKTAMVGAIVAGAQHLLQANTARINAKSNEAVANQIRKDANTASQNTFVYNPDQLAPPGTPTGYDPNAMAAMNGTNPDPTGDSGVDPNAPDGPPLADGNDTGAGAEGMDAPKPGAFKAGGMTAGGAGGGAGGGSGAGGGGGSNGGVAPQEESKAAYASEFGTKERYESGGGISGAGAKGAAKGGSGGTDGGIDLNGLLAQFLPKADDPASQHSILDSVAFGGNRHIAGEEAPSYLDKDADLFQRIHETMSDKNRRGQLGI